MKSLIYGWFVAMAFSVTGAEYFLKSGVTDWSIKESYCTDSARTVEATGVPGSEDTIFVPAGTFSLVSGTDSFNTFANVKRIAPEATNTVIELDVEGGDADNPHVVNAMIYYGLAKDADRGVGTVVKKGSGFLYLGAKGGAVNAGGSHVEYGVNFDVRAGTLRFATEEVNNPLCGFLKVASGAAVWLAQSANNATQMHFDYIEAEAGSLITNATTRSSHVFGISPCGGVYDHLSYIKGALGGGARIWTSGSLMLDTLENSAAGEPTILDNYGEFFNPTGQQRGVLLVKKFGNKLERTASLGYSSNMLLSFGSTGGGVRYIGDGNETTDRGIYLYSAPFHGGASKANAYPAFIDAGETGGVTFTGSIAPVSDANTPPGVRRLFLMGDNANECVVAGPVTRMIKDDILYPVYITKAGTGTWRLADNASRNHVGGTAVRDGTLKFDSITEKGGMCSLGLSTVLTPDDSRAVTNNDYVGYAFALGDEEGRGHPVFEYSGAADAFCSTRPIALVGAGGAVRSSSTAGALDFAGVMARDANTSPTLILDGDGTQSVMRDVSNGVESARVNIAKEGPGTWTLGGDLTLSGKVEARQGTLRVDVPHPIAWSTNQFTWYRLSIAQIANASNQVDNGYQLQLRQICLFDKDGVRQNSYLKMPVATSAGDNLITAQTLQPGQVWLDTSLAGYTINTSKAGFLEECFREEDGYNGTFGTFTVCLKKGTTTIRPIPGDGSTWISIVMRLSDDAHPITHFDLQGYNNNLKDLPTRIKMEGSADGKSWHTVWSNVKAAEPLAPNITSYNCWLSDAVQANNGSHSRAFGTGFTTTAQSGAVYDTFNWYRLSIARIGGNSIDTPATHEMSIRQIGLYNVDGRRLNEGLTLAETPAGSGVTRTVLATRPEEGQIAYGVSAKGLKVKNRSGIGHEIQDCCDGYFNGTAGGLCDISWYTADGAALIPTPADPKTWIPIVMHLPAGTDPVSHFDIQNYGVGDGKMPTRVMLEGSTNGVNWYVIYDNATQGEPFTMNAADFGSYNRWVSDGVQASTGTPTAARPLGKGFPVSGSHPTDPEPKDQFAHVSAIQAQSGATLEATAPLAVSGLDVNTEGAGTIRGFAFAAQGTLNITGEGSLAPLPGVYENCTGLENLANWSLTREGSPVRRGRIVVRDGAVSVLVPGMVMSFR